MKDFIRARLGGSLTTVGALIRPLPCVAASTSATELLVLCKKQRTHAELAEDYDINLETDDIVTVAGLVLAERGTVTDIGAVVQKGEYQLSEEETQGYKITRLTLSKMTPPLDAP